MISDDFLEITYRQKGKDVLSNRNHTHLDSFEIIQTWSDCGTVLIRDKIYPMRMGSLFFISSEEMHSTNPENPEVYERNKVIFSKSLLDKLAALCELEDFVDRIFRSEGGCCFFHGKEKAAYIDSIFKAIDDTKNSDEQFSKAEMIKLLLLLFKQSDSKMRSPYVLDNRIAPVLSYIDANLGDDITVEDLCNAANVSRYYLCHIFKNTVGITISQYVLLRRINLAKEMLQGAELSISDVAMKCGFSSFSYFSRKFKEAEGCSPREYREKSKSRQGFM